MNAIHGYGGLAVAQQGWLEWESITIRRAPRYMVEGARDQESCGWPLVRVGGGLAISGDVGGLVTELWSTSLVSACGCMVAGGKVLDMWICGGRASHGIADIHDAS